MSILTEKIEDKILNPTEIVSTIDLISNNIPEFIKFYEDEISHYDELLLNTDNKLYSLIKEELKIWKSNHNPLYNFNFITQRELTEEYHDIMKRCIAQYNDSITNISEKNRIITTYIKNKIRFVSIWIK